MATDRRAEVQWQGSLLEGSGTIVSTTTGAIGEQAVSWAARSTDEAGGVTSPEELIAAAHASCFSMALANGLSKDGHDPDQLRTSATVTFQPGRGHHAHRAHGRGQGPRPRRGRLPRSSADREGELPRLEGARGRPGDHAGGRS